MIIPGPIIALLTFPGVIVHEFAHKLFCDIFNVPVYYVNYFKRLVCYLVKSGGEVY